MKQMLYTIVLGTVFSMQALGQVSTNIGVDDFLPVVSGGPSEVAKPSEVKVDTKNEIVEAATMQDAANAAVDENIKTIKKRKMESGCVEIKTGSGIGFVATGAGSYQKAPKNPTAERISKRQGYLKAFLAAKKQLSEKLSGLSNESQEELFDYMKRENTLEDEMKDFVSINSSVLRQATGMLLKGFVIYEVEDRVEESMIYVSIVTSPRTRGELVRPSSNSIAADSIREGLEHVITEVRSGVVPPIGGRIIVVPSTGETAFIGFGSAVVSFDDNPAIQAKSKLQAQKIADMRAADSLCGLIVGDETVWEGEILSKHSDVSRQFPVGDDPLDDEAGKSQMNGLREGIVDTLETTDVYKSARKGVLPPGLTKKTWLDDEGAWAYSMCVYMPSASDAAAKVGKSMQKAQILQKHDGESPKARGGSSSIGNTGLSGRSTGTKTSAPVKQGPTGQLSSDDDL